MPIERSSQYILRERERLSITGFTAAPSFWGPTAHFSRALCLEDLNWLESSFTDTFSH